MGMFKKARTAAGTFMPPDYNGMPMPDPTDSTFVGSQQRRMHTYAHTEGLARFAIAFVADGAARVELRAERYVPEVDNGTWVQDFTTPNAVQYAAQARVVNQYIDRFRGRYTQTAQTIWSIIWHKRGEGEVFLAIEADEQLGVVYTPYGFTSCKRIKNPDGVWGYYLTDKPGAKIDEGMRWVPEQTVIRLWTPHPDYPLMPYSTLWSGLKDLDRLHLLNKVIDRASNSALLARGMIWMPGEAMDEMVDAGGGKMMPKLVQDYYASAKQTMDAENNASVPAVAPFLVYYDSDLGKPERIDFKLPFDSEWMTLRTTAIEDFARSTDLPSIMVINGGAGGGGGAGHTAGGATNHWSDLLVDRRTFDMTIGRDLDAVCHEDLTRYFLMQQLRARAGGVNHPPLPEAALWRVGYDPTKLIVNQDRSLHALDAMRMGLINFQAAAKRLGFRVDEMAGPADWKKLQEIAMTSPQTLGITRNRVRQSETNMDGGGTSTVLPHTSSAANVWDGLRMIERDPSLEVVWIDE